MIVSHPEIENSQTQQFLYQASKLSEVNWNQVEKLKKIDVSHEQEQLLMADRIIFQFPLYWYSAPSGLKKWEDEVLTRNFVYGDGRYHLKDKEFGIVVTTGYPEKDFKVGSVENYSLDQILTPYYAIAKRASMKILPNFVISQFWYLSENAQMKLLIDYQRYLTQVQPDSLKNRQEWFQKNLEEMISKLPDNDQATGKVILDTFEQRMMDLDQLKDTLEMIKRDDI